MYAVDVVVAERWSEKKRVSLKKNPRKNMRKNPRKNMRNKNRNKKQQASLSSTLPSPTQILLKDSKLIIPS